MSDQPTSVDVPVYLLVEPTWATYGKDDQGRPILKGGKVVKHTQSKPSVQREGVAVKITLRIPASAFLPLQPEAIVVLRETDAETIVVEAEAPELDEQPESLPHSRACGVTLHNHGPACHANCPTCGGE